MRGRYKRKDTKGRNEETGGAVGLEPATSSAESDSSVSGVAVQDAVRGTKGGKRLTHGDEKIYLGVRVKMPVKDLLRNIRLARGWNPEDLEEDYDKRSKGDKKRVKTCTERRTSTKKCLSKSLEELAIIVEVLEEDLKTGNTFSGPPQTPSKPPESPNYSPQPLGNLWAPEPHTYSYTATYSCSLKYDHEVQMPKMSDCQLTSLNSLYNEYNNYHSPRTISSHSDESDEIIPSPQSYVTYLAGTPECLVNSPPPDLMCSSVQSSEADLHQDGTIDRDSVKRDCWLGLQNHKWNWNSSAFFRTQLQKEEIQLRDISDSALLATNRHGRTALHEVACLGKRALGYAIAKRMAALNRLDLKDSEGMTALHLAAKHNHHLMVADLIQLGASINERNNCGKSCLHLSAENGYIRVLEVLKQMMTAGVYIDAETTDIDGMSVLQCASAALNATVHKLESSNYPSDTRLLTLRKEQLMETLECLLQMGSYIHNMGCGYAENAFDVAYQPHCARSGYPILHEEVGHIMQPRSG